jgi:SagB-type dehydrogenase family enzyme
MRLRRSLGLMAVRTPDEFVVYNTVALRKFDAKALNDNNLNRLLIFMGHWRSIDEVIVFMEETMNLSYEDAHVAIQHLMDLGFLVSDEEAQHKYLSSNYDKWCEKGWQDALLYHWHTNLIPKTDYEADPNGIDDARRMLEKVRAEKPPSNYKEIQGTHRIQLLKKSELKHKTLDKVFEDWVGSKRDKGPLSFEEFSWLTYLAYGQTAVKKLPITGEHVAKTSPSGGSRHPTEVYPLILDVQNINQGLYHYNVKENCLELIKEGNFEEFIRKYILTHPKRPAFRPTVIFIYSTYIDRSMFRYRESRSYRVIHFDLGHLMQTTAFLASSIGRSSYREYAFNDSAIDEFLNIDGLMESVMAFTVIG